jgi:hypothetical protein
MATLADAQLNDPRGAGQRDEQDAEDRREQQRNALGHLAVGAHVRDFRVLTVLEHEDQQQQEYDGEQDRRDPDTTDT